MGLPGKRLSRSSKRRRAAHFALSPKTLTECAKCKKPILPHRMCAYCGTYKGRTIVAMKVKSKGSQKEVPKEEEKAS